jgi:hypothetical protein
MPSVVARPPSTPSPRERLVRVLPSGRVELQLRPEDGRGVALGTVGSFEAAKRWARLLRGLPGKLCAVRKRGRREELPLGVRRVDGGSYQARPWIGYPIGNVNLGLFTSADGGWDRDLAIDAAARAVAEFLKRMAHTPRPDVWDTIKDLQRLTWRPRRDPDGRVRYVPSPLQGPRDVPIVPAHVLAPGVRRTDDGRFAAYRRCPRFVVLGTFDTAEEAWAARQAAGFGPAKGPGRVAAGAAGPLAGGLIAAMEAVLRSRSDPRPRPFPADLPGGRRRVAAYLAAHGPTPGDELAEALGLSAETFWELIDYGWFDLVTGGWGLTARGRAEGLGVKAG